MEQRDELLDHLMPAAQALDGARRKARATGRYTDQQIRSMPIFWVYRTGVGATPEIWRNDFNAMAGLGTRNGLPAPLVLNYQQGIAKVHRRAALGWAATQGIVKGPGQSLDEYPFASTQEGGLTAWLRVAPVARTEQDQQGEDLGRFYRRNSNGWNPFTFLVVLVP